MSPQEARLKRAYGYVFQAAGLYPWRTIAGNIRLPLEIMGFSKAEMDSRVNRVLELVPDATPPGVVRVSPASFTRTDSGPVDRVSLTFSEGIVPATLTRERLELTKEAVLPMLLAEVEGEQVDLLLGGDDGLKPQAATICQRALAILADDYADLVRAGRQADTPLWRFAHALYSSAEALGVAQTPVPDTLRETHSDQSATSATDTLRGFRPVTPAMTYVELVLVAAASLHELAPRQQRWVMRWARRWAAKVEVLAEQPNLTPSLPLCVDLDGDEPPSFLPRAGKGGRWLETSELRKSMKKRLVLLARGDPADTPARLGLGEDCTMPSCGEVLQRLYPRWVKGGVMRRYARHPMSGTCRFVAGVDAVHYYVSGHQNFRPPGSTTSDDLRRQREELAMYGQVTTRFDDLNSVDQGFQLENWTVVEDWGLFDQSEDGLCLVRPIERLGGRLGIGQLVAVQAAGRGDMQLGVVRWTQRRNEDLVTGVQLMSGRPQPVAVRRTGVMAAPDKFQPGFILPEPVSGQLASLVLPLGSYKAERIMETWTQIATRRFKLKAILERGSDFERASCIEVA